MKIRNVSGHDRVVPELGRTVAADEVVTVSDDIGKRMEAQPAIWQAVATRETAGKGDSA